MMAGERTREDNEPWYSLFQGLLYHNEVGEYPECNRGSDEENEDPKVQLCIRPVIPSTTFDNPDRGGHCDRAVMGGLGASDATGGEGERSAKRSFESVTTRGTAFKRVRE